MVGYSLLLRLLVFICAAHAMYAFAATVSESLDGKEKQGEGQMTPEDLEKLLQVGAGLLKAFGDKPTASSGEVPSKQGHPAHGSPPLQSPPPPAHHPPPSPSPGIQGFQNPDALIGLVNTFLPILLQGLQGDQQPQQLQQPQQSQQNPGNPKKRQTAKHPSPPVAPKQGGFEEVMPIFQMMIAMLTKDTITDLANNLPMILQFIAIFLSAQNKQQPWQMPMQAIPMTLHQQQQQQQPPPPAGAPTQPITPGQTQVPAAKKEEEKGLLEDDDRPLMDFFPKAIRPHLMIHPLDELLRRVKGSDVQQLVNVLTNWSKWRSVEDVIIAVKKGAPKIYKVSFEVGVPLGYNFLLIYQLLGVEGKAKLDEIVNDLEAVMDKGRLFLAKLPVETKENIIGAVQANNPPLAGLLSEIFNSNVMKLMMEETLQREKDLKDLAMLEELDLDELAEEIIPTQEGHKEL